MKIIKKYTAIQVRTTEVDQRVNVNLTYGEIGGPYYFRKYPETEFDTEEDAIKYAYEINKYETWLIVPVHRTPDEIKKDIKSLKDNIESLRTELEESRKVHEYELLCTSDWSDDMIGFFNMGHCRIILTELNNGSKLQLRHVTCGTYNVQMNSQRNRIMVEPVYSSDGTPYINEDTIMDFIIWHAGDWYKKIM
jgi:hypothetical protein